MKNLFLSLAALLSITNVSAQDEPLRLAIAGVTHGHTGEVTQRIGRNDFRIVGVYEADARYREKNALTGKVDKALFYSDLEKMLDETKPEAVAAYGSIYDHMRTSRNTCDGGEASGDNIQGCVAYPGTCTKARHQGDHQL